MAEDFWHGIEVVPVTGRTPPAVRTPQTSVIGIVGTAKVTDKAPVDTPIVVRNARQAREIFGAVDPQGHETLPRILAGIYLETTPTCVVISAGASEEPPTPVPVSDESTPQPARRRTRRPVPSGGLGASNMLAPSRIAGELGSMTGVYALLKAKSSVGLQPRIVIAPEFSDDANVRAALQVTAARLRAVAPVESPDTTDYQDVITSFKDLKGSRLYPIYPDVRLPDPIGVVGGSAMVAALIAKTDAALGFWVSPSNRLLTAAIGLSHPVEFSLDPSAGESGANLLNRNRIATWVNEQGFRLWGNRTLADETDQIDSQHKFLSVRRIRDFIDDAILASHLWAVDRNITKNYVSDVMESINNYFRDLKAQEAILGGHCWIDPELNTVNKIREGHVTFDYEFTPPYPAERLTFRSLLSDDHIKEIFA